VDPWSRLRETTQARIGLGRVGDGLPTAELLRLQLGHAQARDAVHGVPDFTTLAREFPSQQVKSAARDRAEYLLRPDLGRRLGPNDLEKGDWDLAIVVADGLSATAVDDHAALLLRAIFDRLTDWTIAPIVLAQNARVALGDEVGAALGARMVAVLIGERPGLTVANSLGAYITYNPAPGRNDSERNCVSNIHAHGLGYDEAARKIVWLLKEGRSRGLTGVMLKEAAGLTLPHEQTAL